jgi:uncharacterized protein YgbK (DUF1537 family)
MTVGSDKSPPLALVRRLRSAQQAVERATRSVRDAENMRRHAVVAATKAGMSRRAIGRQLGLSPARVQQILERAGYSAKDQVVRRRQPRRVRRISS